MLEEIPPTRHQRAGRLVVVALVGVFMASGVGMMLHDVVSSLAVAPPNLIPYQGRVLNNNGVPVSDASLDMQFRLWDSLAGGTCLWSNDADDCSSDADTVVPLTDGLFSVYLGDDVVGGVPIENTVFADNADVYLEVQIEGEVLSPRKLLGAAPYAVNAQTVDGIDSSAMFQQDGNIFGISAVLGTNDINSLSFETGGTTRATFDIDGDFGVGTSDPSARLHVSGTTLVLGDKSVDGNGSISAGKGIRTAISDGDPLVSAAGMDLCTDSLTSPTRVYIDGNADCTAGNGGTDAVILAFSATPATTAVTSDWAFNDLDTDCDGDTVGGDVGCTASDATYQEGQDLYIDAEASLAYTSSVFGVGTPTPSADFHVVGDGSGDFGGFPAVTAIESPNASVWNLVFQNREVGLDKIMGFYQIGSADSAGSNDGSLIITNGNVIDQVQSWSQVGRRTAIGAFSTWSTLAVRSDADTAGIGGTTTASAATAITGVGTQFQRDLGVGDRISLSSAAATYATVTAIGSDTSLTVDAALGNGTSQTINRKSGIVRLDDPSGTAKFMVNDQGRVGIGTVSPGETLEVAGTSYVSGHMAIGADATVDDGSLLYPGSTYSNVLNVSETVTDASVDYVEGFTNYLLYDPSADASGVWVSALDSEVATEATNAEDVLVMTSGYFNATHNGTGVITDWLSGIEAYANTTATSGSSSASYAGSFSLDLRDARSSGTESDYGLYSALRRVGATGGTINTYGVYVDDLGIGDAGAGTSTAYGLYLEDFPTADAQYAIYSEGGDSYLAGNLGIGTATPAEKLSVVGTADVSGHVAVGADAVINGVSLLYGAVTIDNVLNVSEEITTASTDYVEGITSHVLYNPSADASATSVIAVDGSVYTDAGNAQDIDIVTGGTFSAYHQGTGDITGWTNGVFGFAGTTPTSGSAGINMAGYFSAFVEDPRSSGTENTYGLNVLVKRTGATGGTVNTYGVYVDNNGVDAAGAGTANFYGLYLEDITGADTNYALYSAGGQSYHAGNFGIGATSPDADLDIEAAEDTERVRLTDTSNADSAGIYVGDGTAGLDGTLSAQAGSLFLDEDGKLWVNVNGATDWSEVAYSTGAVNDLDGVYDTDSDKALAIDNVAGLKFDAISGDFTVRDSGSVTFATFTTGGNVAFENGVDLGSSTADTISVNGQIDTPLVPTTDGTLDLGSTGNRWGDLFLDGATLHVGDAADDEFTLSYNAATNLTSLNSDGAAGEIAFLSADTERVRIDGSGNVGIGDATPDALLDVAGSFQFDGTGVFGDASGDTVTSNAAAWTFANDTTVNGTDIDFALTGGTDAFTVDGTTFDVDEDNNRVGIGTAAPGYPLTLVTTANPVVGAEFDSTVTGADAGARVAAEGYLHGTYTGTGSTLGLSGYNSVPGSGTSLFVDTANFNSGIWGVAVGAGTGYNVGFYGIGNLSSSLNIGVFGSAPVHGGGAGLTRVGVYGNAESSTVEVGGYFSLRATGAAIPTFTSAALIADNDNEAVPIFLARDNGTTVFTIADGGATTLTSSLSVDGNVTLGDAVTDNITVAAAIQGTNALYFDGSTDDTNETVFAITNPTTDRTITFQNADGTVAFLGDIPAAGATTTLNNLGSTAINASLIPDSDADTDLGSTTLRWGDLYLDGATLHVGDTLTNEGTISYASSIFNFGTDSTTNGDIAFFTDDLYLDKSAGFVGIGDTTPSAMLSVGATSQFQVDSSGNITTSGTLAVNGGIITATGSLDINSLTTTALTLDSGTTGDVNLGTGANAKAIFIGNATSTTNLTFDTGSGGINFGDNANSKSIDIGGVTSSGTDTVSISTNGTAADTIAIGNSNASTTLALTGGDDWSISTTGLITTAGDLAVNGNDITSTGALTITPASGSNFIVGLGGAGQFHVDDSTNGTVFVVDGTGVGVFDQDVFVGNVSSTDDDSVYFDSGGFEYIRWDNTGAEFEVSDDWNILGNCLESGVACDLAETFFADAGEALEEYDVVVSDASGTKKVKKSATAYDPGLMGAVSLQPAILMEGSYVVVGNDDPVVDPERPAVALSGVVRVKVSEENGVPAIGDMLTTSAVAGHAMRATQPGMVLGRAVGGYASTSPGTGTVLVDVKVGWHSGGMIATDGTVATLNGDIAVSATGTASSGTPGMDSFGLALRGSGWDGAAAQQRAMKLVTDVTDAATYKLSIRNQADTEVAYITDDGVMSVVSDMVVGGKLYPSALGVAQTDKYIFYGGAGDDFMRTNATGWGTGSYDFAEMFPSSQPLEPGDVVAFDTVSQQVKKASGDDRARLAGIVSTRPGFLAGDKKEGDSPIALAGRVPTKVTAENGDIAIGDALTVSETQPGYAMKATEAGIIIGYALEPFPPTAPTDPTAPSTIITFVHLGYWTDGTAPAAGTDNAASGFSPSNVSSLTMNGNIYMQGNSILDVGAIAGLGGIWSVDAEGTFRTEGTYKTVIESYQGEQVETTAITSPDVHVTLVGTATLENGIATVSFESVSPSFNDITSTTAPVRVLVTPSGPVSLYVEQKDHNGFTVRQVGGTDSGIAFDWMVSAFRKDYGPVGAVEAVEAVGAVGGETAPTEPAPIEEPPITYPAPNEPAPEPPSEPAPVPSEPAPEPPPADPAVGGTPPEGGGEPPVTTETPSEPAP